MMFSAQQRRGGLITCEGNAVVIIDALPLRVRSVRAQQLSMKCRKEARAAMTMAAIGGWRVAEKRHQCRRRYNGRKRSLSSSWRRQIDSEEKPWRR
jgi:hypothetical protein